VTPKPKLINAQTGNREYVRLLGGPPESVTLRSGAVNLNPGKTVGVHSTENNEELIIVLEGKGEFIFSDEEKLEIEDGVVLYCPPNTEHDVKNTGTRSLKYIYVVAKT